VLVVQAATCVPVTMPYMTSFFMPREGGDRPEVVPTGSVNFAFIGQFAETTRDCIFTTEYSVCTGMEAAHQLLGIDRGVELAVPEVFNSTYDVRKLLAAVSRMRDGEELGFGPDIVRKRLNHKLEKTEIGELRTPQRGQADLSSADPLRSRHHLGRRGQARTVPDRDDCGRSPVKVDTR